MPGQSGHPAPWRPGRRRVENYLRAPRPGTTAAAAQQTASVRAGRRPDPKSAAPCRWCCGRLSTLASPQAAASMTTAWDPGRQSWGDVRRRKGEGVPPAPGGPRPCGRGRPLTAKAPGRRSRTCWTFHEIRPGSWVCEQGGRRRPVHGNNITTFGEGKCLNPPLDVVSFRVVFRLFCKRTIHS
jgi:hypothetical protein